jgi:hypothetical protein
MLQWFCKLFNLFNNEDTEPKRSSHDRIQPLLHSSDAELQIRKPKIFMCPGQRCKNVANYIFNEAYKHNFKCVDCMLALKSI